MYFYEIKCACLFDDWYRYLYTTSRFPIRSLKDVTDTNKLSKEIRIVIDDLYLFPVEVKIMNLFKYVYCKYIKKYFHFGMKITWEKYK